MKDHKCVKYIDGIWGIIEKDKPSQNNIQDYGILYQENDLKRTLDDLNTYLLGVEYCGCYVGRSIMIIREAVDIYVNVYNRTKKEYSVEAALVILRKSLNIIIDTVLQVKEAYGKQK